mmetsp:Transcript_44362/g.71198  ORF Transcript_44362/g.71198 Transcript_44362/m.71198 type:complete len:133 (-) Transcript_44362:123-521(-)
MGLPPSVAEAAVAEVQRTITEVQLQDAVYRADAAAAPPLDPTVEGAALKSLLADHGVCDRCRQVAGEARWGSCADARTAVAELSDAELGGKVATVIDALDAAHLRPTGIDQRLKSGVDAACHGITTLLSNIK